MLSTLRSLRIRGTLISETPIVVPSFSSKGFPDVAKIVETLSQVITDSALISAYDLARGYLKTPPQYPAYLFLDSGGYECSKDCELSDTRSNNYKEADWTQEELVKVLDSWSARQPTVAVSYDHPRYRISVGDQISRAQNLFRDRAGIGHELLIKPSSQDSIRVNIAEVLERIYELRAFDVLGFTERELGYSLFTRMINIAKVRLALDKAGLQIPIHIFGSLDTISTPLYFISGADIFDGLTWLRYCYSDGQAVYQSNAAALRYGIRINDDDVDPKIWFENYQEMMNLEISMRRFVKEGGKFQCFKQHAEFFEQAHSELLAKL